MFFQQYKIEITDGIMTFFSFLLKKYKYCLIFLLSRIVLTVVSIKKRIVKEFQ